VRSGAGARQGRAGADLSQNLFSRYNRIMRLTFVGVLVIAAVLVYLQFERGMESERALLAQRMREHAVSLDAILKASADYVDGMQLQAETWYETHPEPIPASPLLEEILASQTDGFVQLDRPPGAWTQEDLGNLTGYIGARDASLTKELEMALALNPLFKVIKNSIPNAAWVYYTSARDFINIFPWVTSTAFVFSPELYTHEFFFGGKPENNPDRTAFWTEAYLDEYGKGLMVTAAAPVYQGDTFRGTVALDLTLDVLNDFVAGWQSDFGELFVVNDRGQLLAHPRLVTEGEKQVHEMEAAFPEPLQIQTRNLLAVAERRLISSEGYLVEAVPLTYAPFTLVLVAPELDLWIDTLQTGLAAVAMLLIGLTLMLVVATWITRKEFIRPAQQLVRYIEEESRGPAVEIPDVPSGWRPWFETIRRVFNAHTQLVSIRQELDVARRMQQSILPTRFPLRRDIQVFARMIPAKEVGGDFYDYFWFDDHRIGLVIADVSGKGVPAALFMAVARTLLRATATAAAGAGACLEATNDLLSQDNDAAMFVTVFYGIFDTRTGRMTYANGGHNPPCIVAPDGTVSQLPKTGGIALGAMEGLPYEEGTAVLKPGATLLLYTDGVTEAFNPADQEFTERRLVDVLSGTQALGVDGFVGRVVEAVDRFAAGAPQADDITCLALRYAGPAVAMVPEQQAA
jgi:phosphoserine phosphatase RsbU/P